jgi:two-component system, cell cycle sensor histidine kinase and response regulator CckA
MAPDSDFLSVLVINETAEILSFFARMLDGNGIRALLARNADEAVGIAKRGYVPIDLVLTDVAVGPDDADRLRQLRPEVRVLYMSAYLDSGVIRIELMDRGFHTTSKVSDHGGLIESIRAAAARPLVHMAGSVRGQ